MPLHRIESPHPNAVESALLRGLEEQNNAMQTHVAWLSAELARVSADEQTAREVGFPALAQMSWAWSAMQTALLEVATTPGELGMVAAHEGANWTSNFFAAAGSILKNVTWTLAPVMSLQVDKRAASGVSTSISGFQLVSLSSASQFSETGALSRPLTASVDIEIKFPLTGYYSTSTLSQKTTTLQLISSIVGLAGLFSVFGIALFVIESLSTVRVWPCCDSRPPACRNCCRRRLLQKAGGVEQPQSQSAAETISAGQVVELTKVSDTPN
jgi:hypothetical protein